MRARGVYWIAQFIGWMAYGVLLLFAIIASKLDAVDTHLFINIVGLVFFGISVTHLQRWVMIRLGWLNLKLVNLTPRLLIVSAVTSFVINVLLYALDFILEFSDKAHKPLNIAEFLISTLSLGILIMFWNAIYFTFHFFQKSRNQEISNLELTSSNRESELKNLRSQLNPHFLFNSLNSIRALVDLDPAKAKVSITTLSNLLRQSLILGKENIVTIEQELDISRSYLDLEKIRFEERLNVRWEIDDDLLQNKIPPFSIQMMVENSVKHGISTIKEGGVVVVTIAKLEAGFCIKVTNSGTLGSNNSNGVGVQNIKKRLMLQYEDRAWFRLFQEGDYVIAKINFKHEGI
jgi:two-component system LytT family sensor kinase